MMPRVEVVKANRTNDQSTYLSRYAENVTSQDGEDGIIAKIFEVIGSQSKICVEFGAWDGKHLSNTWNLIHNHGWGGVLIEADPERFDALVTNYRNTSNTILINSFIEISGDRQLDNILSQEAKIKEIDFISIDIDGADYFIWDSLDKYRPRVVCIEMNFCVPNNIIFVQDPDMTVNQGASLAALIELGKQKKYELVATTLTNAFFVVEEEFAKFDIKDNSIDAMFDPGEWETFFFQTYDGTLYYPGNDRLIWKKGITFSADDLQALPQSVRKFKRILI